MSKDQGSDLFFFWLLDFLTVILLLCGLVHGRQNLDDGISWPGEGHSSGD